MALVWVTHGWRICDFDFISQRIIGEQPDVPYPPCIDTNTAFIWKGASSTSIYCCYIFCYWLLLADFIQHVPRDGSYDSTGWNKQ